MRSIAVDAGPLIALFDGNDKHHARAVDYFATHDVRLITNIAALTEAVHMLDFSRQAISDLLRWGCETLSIDGETAADLPRIAEIMAKYGDLPADFADASLLAMCERLGLDHIASFDGDFDVYRLADGRPLIKVMAGI